MTQQRGQMNNSNNQRGYTSAPTTNSGPSYGISNQVHPGTIRSNDPNNTPDSQKHRIIAVNKVNNVIAKVKLDDGRILDKQDAVQLALDNQIWGVAVGTTRGEPREHYLRSVPLAGRENFLNNLPTFFVDENNQTQ